MESGTGLGFLIFFPFIAGGLAYLAGHVSGKKKENAPHTGGILRDAIVIVSVVLEFIVMTSVSYFAVSSQSSHVLEIPDICGLGLGFVLDGFRSIYGCVAAFMWMMTAILSREYFAHLHHRSRFYLFLLWTLGATLGVFLSADLYTTFIFFEIMSFTSYVWVAQEENGPALRAADTYLAVAVTGGLVMLMGIFLLYHQLGTLTIGELPAAAANCGERNLLYAAGACMLFGFGAKAGAFPLHIWLPKAHPVAPAPASALLSGILTKTGIYGILILGCCLFPGDGKWSGLILALGVVTMLGGALLAVFSVDLKRTLACSSMSQIGFILVGIGMLGMSGIEGETEYRILATHGTFLHMVNHSLIKLVLFMAAGVVYMNAHALNLNDIRGFGRKKPLLKCIFLIGALAIGGIPLFGGYISKTLLHESIVEYGGGAALRAVEYIFLFSGGLTVAYMTKLFVAVFMERNGDFALQEKYDSMKGYMKPATVFALAGSAAVLLAWGLCPHGLMDRAAQLAQGFFRLEETGHQVHYFSFGNLKGGLISIGIGGLVYLFFIRRALRNAEGEYVNAWPEWLDLEELLYRPLLLRFLPWLLGGLCGLLHRLLSSPAILKTLSAVAGVFCRILDSLVDGLVVFLRKTLYRDSPLPYERPEGNVFTEKLGVALNAFQILGNRTWRRKNPVHRDYVHLAAMKNEQFRETNHIIQRSLSFGLLLFCIGLSLTLLYIIWW
ncbi:MAG: NADH dehydrogenase [Lachnospiraceae bacterium]|uniref:complex I subunit 5 family protein n=1 Tax=uncultured Acetatifactor sp. TaxID=1671927 RepID=UPI0026263167|nr:complex I subunit 5 family protein [uncultured Acetatifactor sp.]MCI8788352.1 NADH dehydrogenase [Lachnospiraceae bacterium]